MALMDVLNLAQIIGFLALGLGVAGLLHPCDRRLKILLSLQSFTLSIHYALMGAHSGAVVTMITALRNLLSLKADLKPVAFVFISMYVVFGFSRYQVWYDILPILACCSSTLAMFYLRDIYLRFVLLGSTACFFIFNLFVGSIGPAIMEAMMLGANLRTIAKLNDRNRVDT